MDRIIDAAIGMVGGRDFAELSISSICVEADVSPSSFYSRFRDADALLRVLHERHLELMYEATVTGTAEHPWGDLTLDELIIKLCELFVATGRKHEAFFRSMQRTEIGRPDLTDRRIVFERAGLDLLVDLVAERFPTLDAGGRLRLRVALSTLLAVLREVLGVMQKADVAGLDEAAYFAELAAQFCSYTGLDPTPPSSRRTG